MPLFQVVSSDGRAEIEEAADEHEARRDFIRLVRELDESEEDKDAFERATITVKEYRPDDGYCVCGTHISEHLLCGCGEFERPAYQWR